MDAAAAAGYDGIELWGKEPHTGDKSPETCEEIVARARDRSLAIPVYGSYLRPGSDSFEASFRDELAVAEQLDAELIRVWAGEREYEERTEEHWQAVVGDLTTLADAAAERGLGITVEKHGNSLTNHSEGARRLIEAVERDNCGLNYQPMFSIPADDILAEARDLAPLSNNMHVQATPERNSFDRCPLEDAFFDVETLLSTFKDADFDGYVNVEFVTEQYDYEEAVARDLTFLQSCID